MTDKELEEARFELFLSKQRLLRQAAVDALEHGDEDGNDYDN